MDLAELDLGRSSLELSDLLVELIVNFKDRSLVAASVAIVRCGEKGEELVAVSVLVSIHHELMRSHSQREAIRGVPAIGDVLAEDVAGATRRDSPRDPILRVGPDEVADRAVVGHLVEAVQFTHIVQRVELRGEASVNAEDLVVDDDTERKVVEQVGEVFPDIGRVVLLEALVIESIHLRDLP